MLIVSSQVRIPLREIEFTFSRSSGPGGQNVNKVNGKATLRWPALSSPSLPEGVRGRFAARYRRRLTSDGELIISSQRFRDAGRNVADCLEKLRQMLFAVLHAPKARKATRPGRAAVRRRLEEKKKQSQRKRSRRLEGID